MAEIEVNKTGDETFEVTVKDRGTTTHTVTVRQEDYQRLTGSKVPAETLVRASFEFLLERESNSSILSQFELPVISRYFPEYEKTIQQRLQ